MPERPRVIKPSIFSRSPEEARREMARQNAKRQQNNGKRNGPEKRKTYLDFLADLRKRSRQETALLIARIDAWEKNSLVSSKDAQRLREFAQKLRIK